MLEDVLRDQERISGDVSQLDYFVDAFSKMIVESNEKDEVFKQVIQFSRVAADNFDLLITAHHRRFLLKYAHVIRMQDGQPELFGEYRLLELNDIQSGIEKFKTGELLSFTIDQNGNALVNERTILCAPNPIHEREQRKAFKKAVLFSIHKSMVPAE